MRDLELLFNTILRPVIHRYYLSINLSQAVRPVRGKRGDID